MSNSTLVWIFFLNLSFISVISGTYSYNYSTFKTEAVQQDTLPENQILYNGKLWKNLYFMTEGDQFLFSKEFISGSVTIKGKTFSNILIKYDLYNDEILTPADPGGIVQLNKERVDSFSLFYEGKTYHFIKNIEDCESEFNGYVNLLSKGDISLFLKYVKKINAAKTEGQRDRFYLTHRLYIVKDSSPSRIRSNKNLLDASDEYKTQIKDYIRRNKIRVSEDSPDSIIPVISYWNIISQ